MRKCGHFIIRLLQLACIIAILMRYNYVIAQKDIEADIRAEQKLAAIEAVAAEVEETTGKSAQASDGGNYTDGKYEGTGAGFGGDIVVQVTIESGKISAIDVLSHDGDDDVYFDMAVTILDDMIAAQSADVDVISGATFSSQGLIDAVNQSLDQAAK